MAELSLSACERLLRRAGAKRVSPQAAQELRARLEEFALHLGAEAAKLAKHASRVTVTDEDVRLAR